MVFFLAFYIPGRWVLTKINEKTDIRSTSVLTLITGIALWGLQAYVFGYLKARYLTYLYLIMGLLWWLVNFKKEIAFGKKMIRSWLEDKWLLIIIASGIVVVLAGVFSSGLPNKEGLWIFGINVIDGSYHLSLIESLIKGIPPREPGMVGVEVANYHYWSDMVLAELIRIFKIPAINLFYQYFPVLNAVLLGLASYVLARKIGKDKICGKVMAALMYFSGNWGYLLILLLQGRLTFEMKSFDNGAILFTNPPRALAELIYLGSALSVFLWLKRKNLGWGWLTALLVGVVVGFKVYVGIVAALGLAGLFVYWCIKKKWKRLLPIVAAGLLSIAVFFPANSKAGGIRWSPLAWPRHYFAQGEASTLMWHLQERVFTDHDNKPRLILLYIQMLVAFFGVIYGSRMLGLLGLNILKKKAGLEFWIFWVIPLVSAIFLATFFLQDSGAFEIFNLYAVAGVSLSLLSALWLKNFKGKRQLVIIILFIVVSLPKPISQAVNYIKIFREKNNKAWLFTNNELELFRKMRQEIGEDELVILNPDDSINQYTPYLAAFTGNNLYFSGAGVLRAHGLDVSQYEEQLNRIWSMPESEFVRAAKERGIRYMFSRGGNDPQCLEKGSFFELVDSSGNSKLYRIKYE